MEQIIILITIEEKEEEKEESLFKFELIFFKKKL